MKPTEITERRITRLRELIKTSFDNNISKLATALGQKPSYFSDVLGGRKAFAEKKVRQMERDLKLEPFYFDLDDDGKKPVHADQVKSDWPFEFPMFRYERLLDDQKKEIGQWVEGRIKMFEAEAAARKKRIGTERSQRSRGAQPIG